MNKYEEHEEVITCGRDILFIGRLGIGEEAYTYSKNMSTFANSLAAGHLSGKIAASSVVANALFPATGFQSVLAAVGLGAGAVTPIGWVWVASAAGAGLYYGASKLLDSKKHKMSVPRKIGIGLDPLAKELLHHMLPLSLKIARADGQISYSTMETIADYYEGEWGYVRNFVIKTMNEIKNNIKYVSYFYVAEYFSDYCDKNRYCNREFIAKFLLEHLEEISEMDNEGDSTEKAKKFMFLERVLSR